MANRDHGCLVALVPTPNQGVENVPDELRRESAQYTDQKKARIASALLFDPGGSVHPIEEVDRGARWATPALVIGKSSASPFQGDADWTVGRRVLGTRAHGYCTE